MGFIRAGQVVRIAGNDLFAVNTDPAAPSFGLLVKDYKSGDMPGIYCDGGVYETDVFDGVIAAITNGKAPMMPGWGESSGGPLNAAEIEAVATFVWTEAGLPKKAP